MVETLSKTSLQNATLSRVGANDMLFAQDRLTSAYQSGNATFAAGRLIQVLDLGNRAGAIYSNADSGSGSNIGNLYGNTVSSLSDSLDSIINNNQTLDAASINTINSSQLATAINDVNTAASQLSVVLASINNPAAQSALSQPLARQQNALAALNTTLNVLQKEITVNTNNVRTLSPDNLRNVFGYGETQTASQTTSAVQTVTSKYQSAGDGNNQVTDQLKQSIVSLANGQLNPTAMNALKTQDSAQTIDGIINGNAQGNAVKATTNLPAVKESNKPLNIQVGTGNQNVTTTEITSNGSTVKSLKKAVADVEAANKDLSDAVLAVAVAQNGEVGAAAAAAANSRRNSAPTILPTAKAGLIAFFGKHQSVSVEYQYYFRNTNPSFTSGEVTLNYAYYFGGK
ncbi:hypothetical protein BKH43_07660 [Helicobacter sp. 13S00401-1]|uniref:hypothetical protein n=1 Tax=Helicobacter sp. 13S00401-1 TaxID=1905758 RepID=UPI000BA7C0F9|nr:hypothetical protein [Helicobacter sp. 13S00401-1]PAF48799.1 hypothetical protein BKH43_07660 [Helicobacter sp. 13S00401-1]